MAHRHRDRRSEDQLAREIASLGDLDADTLRARWLSVTGKAPAPGIRGDLLMRCLAYLMQEKALGGLSLATRRQLDVLAQEAACGEAGTAMADPRATQRRLMPGTRLVRKWQGTSHEVIVIPDGFLWQGTSYASLSTVARAITGTSWNGWVFFGAKTGGGASCRGNTQPNDPAMPASDAVPLPRTSRAPAHRASRHDVQDAKAAGSTVETDPPSRDQGSGCDGVEQPERPGDVEASRGASDRPRIRCSSKCLPVVAAGVSAAHA